MRLIDADALMADIERTIENSGCVNHEGDIMDCVRYAPTVDAVQVCRCRDCTHFRAQRLEVE
jgi:antirestriction protein ArdC